MFSSELFCLKFLGPLISRLQILNGDGEGVLDTNFTGEQEPDCSRGEGDFLITLDLDPESEGDFVLGPDFDQASPGLDSPDDLQQFFWKEL